MKKLTIILGLLLIASTVNAATIYVYVHNVNGNLVSSAQVKLYDNSWNLIAVQHTNSSGMATFALLDYGYYNYEVYYDGDANEFWGSDENFYLGNPTLERHFYRNWPYLSDYNFSPSNSNVGQQVTIQITVKNNLSYSRNVKVELWIDRSQSSLWDFNELSSAQSINGGGTKTYIFYMTANFAGTYYWKAHITSYNDGANDYIVTDTYPWSEAFNASVQEGDLDVYVYNINSNLVEGAQVKLYDENWNLEDDEYTNSSGRADFNNLNYGIYHYEVYYLGDTQEFWGGDENIDINSPYELVTFTRNWPYRYSYNEPPTIIDINNQAAYDITVKNNLSFSRNVKVELWVDRDQSSPWDFYETSSSQSISSDETKNYTLNFAPTLSGTYYWKMHVLSYNDGAGDYIVTDSYSWLNSFKAINNQTFPLNEGVIVYHSYTDYEYAWDSKLFMYNFSTETKSELSSNWNIDHEMNAHISPDGTQIVFMGDDSGLPRDWDIYIWNIGSINAPTNLTSSNNLRDEDPKFSPDGNNIIFKQNGDIKVMNLIGTILNTITNDGSTKEESMPYYTTDGQQVIYAKGVKENSDIYIINIDGSNNTALYNVAGVTEYYPVVKDNSSFFYSRWISSSNHLDQVYLGDFFGNSSSLSINDSESNNSDAYPVDSDYLFFSSTRNSGMGGYDLYLGQISTGKVWSLNDFGINSSLEDLGVCYNSIGFVPVELISFCTSISEGKVILRWATASEKNNLGFGIEKSIDKSNFKKIGFVKGNGTTFSPKYYCFVDNTTITGTCYYRLKQTDTDGSFGYSEIVETMIELPQNFKLIQNSPNPFNPVTKIQYQLPKACHTSVKIYSIYGQEIRTLVEQEQQSGVYSVVWDGKNNEGRHVGSGCYIYTMHAGKFRVSKKIIFLH